jgi:putative membrane protein
MKFNRQLLVFSLILTLATLGFIACSRETGVEAARESDQPALLPDTPAVSPAEQEFMMKVSQANTSEIMMARQAMQRSGNKDVKDFAHMIESDHTKALDELTELMKNKNVSQSRVPSPEAAQEMDTLNKLSGAEYDRQYANMMVEKHEKSIDLFREQIDTARNPDVKEFASGLLPTLEMHLEKARAIQSKLFSGNGQ